MKSASSTRSFVISPHLFFGGISFPQRKETLKIENPKVASPFTKHAQNQSLDTSAYLSIFQDWSPLPIISPLGMVRIGSKIAY